MQLNNNQMEMLYGIENYHNWVHITCRRAGKTIGCLTVAKNFLFRPNQHIVVFESPNNPIIKDQLIKEIPSSLINHIKVNKAYLVNGNTIEFRKYSKLPETSFVVNKQPTLVIFDEPAIWDDLFEENLREMEFYNPKILIASSPRGTVKTNNHKVTKPTALYACVEKGKSPLYCDWATKTYSWKDINYWTDGNHPYEKMPKNDLYEREIEAKFIDD